MGRPAKVGFDVGRGRETGANVGYLAARMQLSDVKALVTGGTSGIGLATAYALKRAGAGVVVAGRDPERLERATAATGAYGVRADVRQAPDVTRMFNVARERLGGLDVLVNNAGYGYVAPLVDIDAARFEEVWRTNVLGAMLCAREAARHFVARGRGAIVNVGSTAALRGAAGASPYAATKFALRGMTEAWRRELRPAGVRVMLVNPSEVMTSFAANRVGPDGEPGGGGAGEYSEAERLTKLRGEEVAQAIVGLIALDDRALVTEVEVWATNPVG